MKYTQFNFRQFEAHQIAYNLVPAGARVLDVGCATGYFAKELKKKHCAVVGVEKELRAAAVARLHCERIVVADLEHSADILLTKHSFDVVLLLDVLEHIMRREQLLRAIRTWIKPGGILIISTPNIAHISIRLQLLFGSFTYRRWGIMDETHVHFFTKETLLTFLETNGYTCDKVMATADFGQLPVVGRWLRNLPKPVQFIITSWAPRLLGIQFVVRCHPSFKT